MPPRYAPRSDPPNTAEESVFLISLLRKEGSDVNWQLEESNVIVFKLRFFFFRLNKGKNLTLLDFMVIHAHIIKKKPFTSYE